MPPKKSQPEADLSSFPVETIKVGALTPHPHNYRIHPEDQLEQIGQSIREHGIYRPVVVASDNTILAGHGLVAAAQRIGLEEIPVYRMNVAPDSAQALKVLAGDNELGHMAEVDKRQLLAILSGIREESPTAFDGTGFSDAAFKALLQTVEAEEAEGEKYTRKIVAPIYEPTAKKAPPLRSLTNREKADALIAAIVESGLPEEVQAFLRLAAMRHVQFDYAEIAEYYAHAPAKVQRLMEASALVIIDFDRAIEEGFVRLSTDLGHLWEEEHGES
jgi:ParB-like chromosome segregation protein Spo0J